MLILVHTHRFGVDTCAINTDDTARLSSVLSDPQNLEAQSEDDFTDEMKHLLKATGIEFEPWLEEFLEYSDAGVVVDVLFD